MSLVFGSNKLNIASNLDLIWIQCTVEFPWQYVKLHYTHFLSLCTELINIKHPDERSQSHTQTTQHNALNTFK